MEEADKKPIITKEMLHNLNVIVGEYKIEAKHFYKVISPIAVLLENIESGKWILVKNPDYNPSQDNKK